MTVAGSVVLFHNPFYTIQLGDIFTIHVAGKRMTFVTNSRDYQHYFTTTDTDFQAAVQPFTNRAGRAIPYLYVLCLQ